MFGKLFGSKPKISEEEQKKIHQEKLNLDLQNTAKKHQQAIENYDLQINDVE